MDPIERGLQQDIPLGEAASFFLKVKHGNATCAGDKQLAAVRDRLRGAAKEKNSNGMGEMPATAMGKNMQPMPAPQMPAAAMGQHKMGAARGPSRAQERAHEALEVKFEKHHHTKGERAGGNAGGALGAAAGAAAGHKFGKSPHATAAGALVGYALGKAQGKSIGTSLDSHKFQKKHAMFKRALEEQGMAPAGTGDDGEVPITDYLAAHQEGLAAEEDNQAAFLRQKLQEAQALLQQTQQEAQMAQSTAQQAQAAQAQHEQQMQAVQQQSQMATAAAMQNVNQAHELALKATSQALQSKDDAINTHQLAANMRMAYQDLRGNIMDTVAQDNAAPVGEAIKAKGMESQVMPPGGEVGADGQPVEQEAGPAGEAASPGAPPGRPPPGGEAPEAQEPVEEAGGAEEPAPAGETGIKAAGAWGDAARHMGKQLRPRLPHMAAGAAIGAGLPLIEAARGHDGLRQRVGQLQQEHDQGGGFGTALMLAQSKMRLAIGELSEQHPGAASAMGGVIGGIAGAVQGPEVWRSAMGIPGQIKELRK